MNKLLWITDAHLDHLSDALEDAWFEKVANNRPFWRCCMVIFY